MLEQILLITEPRNLITLVVAIAGFATIYSLGTSISRGDPFKERMKLVSGEREKMRQASRQDAAGSRLRNQQASGAKTLTELFKLGEFMQAAAVREKLKQAGMRTEKHVYTFVLARLIGMPAGALIAAYFSLARFEGIPLRVQAVIWLGGAVIGYMLPGLVVTNAIQRRQKSIRRSWPDALDVMLICVEAGMSLEPAMSRVAKEIGTQSVPLAEELTLTVAELSYLGDRRHAFENLAKRVDLPAVKSVTTAFIQAERYGTPLGQALRVISQETRENRMQEAEKKAAALPSKLTVPMIMFFLPVVFVVILGPSILQIFK